MPTDQQASGGSCPCDDRWHCSTVGSAVISHGAVIARRIMTGCSLAHTEAFLFLTDFIDYSDLFCYDSSVDICRIGMNFFGLLRLVVSSG